MLNERYCPFCKSSSFLDVEHKVSIIIPCYNEEDNVEETFERILRFKTPFYDYEVIFVDDGSTDRTPEILNDPLKFLHPLGIVTKVITHEKNMGLGRALYSGFQEATGDVIITIDSDLSHDIRLFSDFIEGILSGNDLVIGSRYVDGGGMVNVPFWRTWVSKLASNVFPCDGVSDKTSGYRAYSKMVKSINVERDGFEAQLEILLKMKEMGAKIKEIPMVLVSRKRGYSKFNLLKVARGYASFLMSNGWKK